MSGVAYASLGTWQGSGGGLHRMGTACCIAWALHRMGMHANVGGRVDGLKQTLTRVRSPMLDGACSPPERVRSCYPRPMQCRHGTCLSEAAADWLPGADDSVQGLIAAAQLVHGALISVKYVDRPSLRDCCPSRASSGHWP